ncbi:MAG: hypothetical protein J6W96_00305, partial [Alphaproteobacteria bacterium]|nr:hypothetical protein [Alphaproteobacteria bacterium]
MTGVKQNRQIKKLWGFGGLLASFVFYSFNVQAEPVAVSSWADINENKGEASIIFANDIQAELLGEFPGPITFSTATEQTIDGNYHNFSSQDVYDESDDSWYYYSLAINNTAALNVKNFGKYVAGTAGSNTFSYTDLEGNTVYKTIEASVNNWKSYFLTVHTPIEVSITNSVFADNGYTRDARLIYVSVSGAGTLNITDSIFYNNTMADSGPVISGGRFNTNIENTIFYGNKNAPNSGDGSGGALKVDGGGKVTVKDSYFINNVGSNRNGSNKGKGGAIYIAKGNGHTIENVKFEGNTSAQEGGAVYVHYNATTDSVKNSQFIGNTQTSGSEYGGGGGLAIGGGYIRTIDNVLFDSNSSANKGGGLYIEEMSNTPSTPKVALVKDTVFKDNEALLGGGMYFSADYGNNAKFSARVVDPEFTNNTATQGGGLYVINGDVGIISAAKDVIFSGNSATDNTVSNAGDDIYFLTKSYAATLSLNAAENKKIVFDGTIATAKTKTNVPVIDINKSGVTYSTYEGETETVHNAGTAGEIQFNNRVGDGDGNTSNINLYGGMLSIGKGSTANNPDGLINDNNFTVAGDSTLNTANGVIGEFSPVAFAIDAALSYQLDVDLANGVSDKLVGAVVGDDGSLILSSLNIISDADVRNLKVVYSDTNIGGVLKNGYTITTSEASYTVTAGNDDTGSYLVFTKDGLLGGLVRAIQLEENQKTYTMTEEEEINEEATLNGDSLSVTGDGNAVTGNGTKGVKLAANQTLSFDGVDSFNGFSTAITNNGGTVNITDTVFENNNIAVLNSGGTLNIDGSTFSNNQNTTGAIVNSNGVVTITDTNFEDNTGKVLEIKLAQTTDTATITNATFYHNTSTTADRAILTLNRGTVELNGLVFDSNEAKNGAVNVDFYVGTIAVVNDAVVQNNKGGWYGAFQLSGGVVDINGSQFINNQTTYDGGAITVTSTMQNITDSIFKNNKAVYGAGGAIWYSQLASSPYIVNTTFEANQSGDAGGAMFIGGTGIRTGTVYLIGSDIKDNEAPYGGGIYSYESNDFFVVDTDFTGNTADEGAAIYAQEENLNIFANTKDVIFRGNTANNTDDTYNGGSAVYYDVREKTGVAFNINAANGKKVIFDDTIAAYGDGVDVNMNINKSGLSYDDIEGDTVDITNVGEVQFNDRVGDEEGNIFNINLYGGKLSIGQNATTNAGVANPDGFINDNNFTVAGDSTLNTANGIIGEFSPLSFAIDAALSYQFDVDLANGVSDKLVGAVVGDDGSLILSSLNIISDADVINLKVIYSDTNIGGVLKDDYTITTSEASYNVTAGNDNTGSYLLFTKDGLVVGLPGAIKNASDAYSITDDNGEVVEAWIENDLKADLVINGNGKAITTENNLDGINVGEDYTLTMNNVSDMNGFNYAVANEGTLVLNDTSLSDEVINDGVLNASGEVALGVVTGEGTMNILSGVTTLSDEVAQGGVVVGNSEGTETTLNVEDSLTVATLETKGGATVNNNGSIIAETITNAVDGMIVSDADGLTASNGIINNGLLELTGGTNANAISGSGVTEISGEVANANTIGTNLAISGTLTTTVDKLDMANKNLQGAGGTLDLSGNTAETLAINTLDLTAGDLNVLLDVDLANQTADKLSVATISGENKLVIGAINLLSDAESNLPISVAVIEATDAAVADMLTNNVELENGPVTINGLNPSYSYLVSYTAEDLVGNLTFSYADLVTAIVLEADQKAYTMAGDEAIDEETALKGDSLSVAGNGNGINGDGNNGITLAENQTLSLDGVDSVNGFDTAITNNGGTVNVTDTVFEGNNVDIVNDGVLNASGEVALGVVTGEGTMNILSGVTTLSDEVAQGGVV